MTLRQSMLASPLRVVGAAAVVILLFALLFPFVGAFSETIPATGTTVTYALEPSDLSEPTFVYNVLGKSLHLSVQTFTSTGASRYTTVVEASYLADIESLLGMGFLALFTASLLRDE